MADVSRDPSDRYFDASLLNEYSEGGVREAIAKLSAKSLATERGSLITRLVPQLALKAPTIFWAESRLECDRVASNKWICSILASMDDPSWTSWSVRWPTQDDTEVDYAADSEQGVFVVRQTVSAESADAARQIFSANVDRFKINVLRMEAEIERYNAALPYLISMWLEVRLDGYPVTDEGLSSSIAAIKRELFGQILEGLVASGDLMFVEEIDPKTGKLRKRYFHPTHAPKAN